jgi:hypothetical protein
VAAGDAARAWPGARGCGELGGRGELRGECDDLSSAPPQPRPAQRLFDRWDEWVVSCGTQDEETELLALERAGWQTLWDAEEEDFYYHHGASGRTQWERPQQPSGGDDDLADPPPPPPPQLAQPSEAPPSPAASPTAGGGDVPLPCEAAAAAAAYRTHTVSFASRGPLGIVLSPVRLRRPQGAVGEGGE